VALWAAEQARFARRAHRSAPAVSMPRPNGRRRGKDRPVTAAELPASIPAVGTELLRGGGEAGAAVPLRRPAKRAAGRSMG
jgi:hypothetical protein